MTAFKGLLSDKATWYVNVLGSYFDTYSAKVLNASWNVARSASFLKVASTMSQNVPVMDDRMEDEIGFVLLRSEYKFTHHHQLYEERIDSWWGRSHRQRDRLLEQLWSTYANTHGTLSHDIAYYSSNISKCLSQHKAPLKMTCSSY